MRGGYEEKCLSQNVNVKEIFLSISIEVDYKDQFGITDMIRGTNEQIWRFALIAEIWKFKGPK